MQHAFRAPRRTPITLPPEPNHRVLPCCVLCLVVVHFSPATHSNTTITNHLQAAYARRGAPWTFNAAAFVDAIRTIRQQGKAVLPSFDHGVGDPVEGDIVIDAGQHSIVLVSGGGGIWGAGRQLVLGVCMLCTCVCCGVAWSVAQRKLLHWRAISHCVFPTLPPSNHKHLHRLKVTTCFLKRIPGVSCESCLMTLGLLMSTLTQPCSGCTNGRLLLVWRQRRRACALPATTGQTGSL